MKIILLCVILHSLSARKAEAAASQAASWNVDHPQEQYLPAEDEFQGIISTLYAGNQVSHRNEFNKEIKRITDPDNIFVQTRVPSKTQSSNTFLQSLCTCETQYEIRDLGEGHYPRYITASHCKPKACQRRFNSCKLLHYMVHVLSQRDFNGLSEDQYVEDNVLPETPLPESLRHKWQLRPMSVAVACIPELNSRGN